MTLVELTLALGVLAVATGCQIEVLASINIGRERLWKKQQAVAAVKRTAEEILLFDGDSSALHAEYNAPPAVVVQDADGDVVFDSGWAKVTVRETVQQLGREASEEVKLVFGKAE